MPRPFKIPLNVYGLGLMALLPLSVYLTALAGAFAAADKMWLPAVFALAALLSGEVVWRLINLRRPNLSSN